MEIFKEYSFEAAHHLPQVPPEHPCGRMHGHSYRVVLHVSGQVDADTGWVLDFAEMDAAMAPLFSRLDHHLLNEIEGLENPTCEVLAIWLWTRLRDSLGGLSRIDVWETGTSGCSYSGDDLS